MTMLSCHSPYVCVFMAASRNQEDLDVLFCLCQMRFIVTFMELENILKLV